MKNLKPVVLFIAEFGNVFDGLTNGKNEGSKLSVISQLFDEAMALGAVDFSLVDDEFKEALKDSEKMSEIQSLFAGKLEIEDEKLEAFIEEGILLVKENYEVIKRDIEFIRKIKNA